MKYQSLTSDKSGNIYTFRCSVTRSDAVNIFGSRKNGRHSVDYILKLIYMYEDLYLLIQISLKFEPKYPIINSALV